MNINEIPNIKKVAEEFVGLEIFINDLYDQGMGESVRSHEAKADQIITTLLMILGLCTYGGSRQWCREQLRHLARVAPS